MNESLPELMEQMENPPMSLLLKTDIQELSKNGSLLLLAKWVRLDKMAKTELTEKIVGKE